MHLLSSFDPVYLLPENIIPLYLSNLYKQKYFETRIREWVDWPSSAFLAKASGFLGALPVVVIVATGEITETTD